MKVFVNTYRRCKLTSTFHGLQSFYVQIYMKILQHTPKNFQEAAGVKIKTYKKHAASIKRSSQSIYKHILVRYPNENTKFTATSKQQHFDFKRPTLILIDQAKQGLFEFGRAGFRKKFLLCSLIIRT